MFLALDGPALQGVLAITDIAVTEVKVGASRFTERKVVTMQPTTGKMYVLFGSEGITPTPTDLSTKGFLHFKNQQVTYEAGDEQSIYVMSFFGANNVRIAERG